MSESLDGVGIAAAIRSQGAQEQYYRAINRRLLLMGYQLGLDGDFDDDPFSPGTQKGPPAQVGLAVVPVDGSFQITLTLPQDVPAPSVTVYQNYILRERNKLRGVMMHQLQSATSVLFDAASNALTYGPFTETYKEIQMPNVTLFWRVRSSYDGTNWNDWLVYSSPATCGPLGVSSGFLRSTAAAPNMSLNTSNNCTADSFDAGGSATARIYGPGGVGTSWIHYDGQGGQTSISGGSVPGLLNSKQYVLLYTAAGGYQAFQTIPSQMPLTLPDGMIWSASITTAAAGGGTSPPAGGGVTGGGGGGGRGIIQ